MAEPLDIDWSRSPAIHVVGVGGMAMSAIAQIALDRGATVSGSDINDSDYIRRLREQGARIRIGHRPQNLGPATLLVHSAAVGDDNAEIAAARARAIPVVDRARFIAGLLSGKKTLAVAGTHGKTTTSAMASFALQRLGCNPTYLVGANVPQLSRNAAWGEGDFAVVEADEVGPTFGDRAFPNRKRVAGKIAGFVNQCGGSCPAGFVEHGLVQRCQDALECVSVAHDDSASSNSGMGTIW